MKGLRGPCDDQWTTPPFLMAHQVDAAKRLLAILRWFGGAFLCDAVGLGKTYVALAIGGRFRNVIVVAPSILKSQWCEAARRTHTSINFISHESLSHRGAAVRGDLVIVDEAHRFRNENTRRYDHLARSLRGASILLLTATPVVNRTKDLIALLRLFLGDNQLACLGLPSLAGWTEATLSHLTCACAPLIVARTTDTASADLGNIPSVETGVIRRDAPIETRCLSAVLRLITQLTFPSFTNRTATELLRLHLYYRLSSSIDALVETLRRHDRFLSRAIGAAARGELLTRKDVRQLTEYVDLQLELGALWEAHCPMDLDPAPLYRERNTIRCMLRTVAASADQDPKLRSLGSLLNPPGAKVVVFTNAVSTAHAIARHMNWRRVAVVSGRGGRIASGAIPVHQALQWFAPKAFGLRTPDKRYAIDTLIATDLASEGLNLQDASVVIHYDLPWTPLRLQQRNGRLVRLGSEHHRVTVHWYQPHPEIERHLTIIDRLEAKAAIRRRLGFDAAPSVFSKGTFQHALGHREIALSGRTSADLSTRKDLCGVAITWVMGTVELPSLIVVNHQGAVHRLEDHIALVSAPATQGVHTRLPPALQREMRSRFASANGCAADPITVALRKRVLTLARATASNRNYRRLDLLDQILRRLDSGLCEGARRELIDIMAHRTPPPAMQRWLSHWPTRPRVQHWPRIDAIVSVRR